MRLPNGGNVEGYEAIGHTDGTGKREATNDFGDAFEKAGNKWTLELCQADTDGDGQTNGQELGDPCCEWSQGDTPRWTSGVSHPSDSSLKSDSSLWESINCSAVTTIATGTSGADESLYFVKRIPNGANVEGFPALGHADGTGKKSATNSFGKAFDRASNKWTVALCEDDTDGDGQTNGQELGDPCCVWTEGSDPLWTTGISHPSNKDSTSDEALWANISCDTTDTATNTTTSTSTGTSGAKSSIPSYKLTSIATLVTGIALIFA
ncbi:unnamed protein product [Phytophthora lilii]|uniref:Unnamed protein product n=1 Tax=Phytophthora lilii TaxID=2077276 RepID=A0A9W6X3L1_9STRA|nr:unnamed protein product [Phytophthora lilii]